MSPDDDPDFSPLVNLNGDVELAILKQLELRDYVNLASICHKWYNRTVTAPRSIKPVVKVDDLTMWYDGFETTINGKPTLIPRNYEENIALLYKIECKTLIVKHGFMKKSRKRRNGCLEHSVDYLIEHRDVIKMDGIRYEPGRDKFTKADLMIKLFKVSNKMFVGNYNHRIRISSKQKIEIAVAVEQCVHAKVISCDVDIPNEVIKRVLEAVATGNRPHLKLFRCDGDRRFITGKPLNKYLLEGLEDRIVCDRPSYDYVLSYSDSHEIELYVCSETAYINFDIVPKRDRSRFRMHFAAGWMLDDE